MDRPKRAHRPPSAPVKVLIADEAVLIRKLLRTQLSDDSNIDVVGVAASGAIALRKIEQLEPDLVVLDVEIPTEGAERPLTAIRANWPSLPVIMLARSSEDDAECSLEAMASGATATLIKPSQVTSEAVDLCTLVEELSVTIKSICLGPMARVRTPSPPAALPTPAEPSPPARRIPSEPVELIAIGSSTGGPNALTEVISALPSDLPVPIVVAQHMPPVFTHHLAARLDSCCDLTVSEASHGVEIHPGTVWIAPGGYHMVVRRRKRSLQLELNQDPPENSCRPAVDPLLRSVAEAFGPSALAVILTGMGADGLKGCEQIRRTGGRVLVQDEESSVVWGMPGAVSTAGLADSELPLNQIGPTVARWCQQERKGSTL